MCGGCFWMAVEEAACGDRRSVWGPEERVGTGGVCGDRRSAWGPEECLREGAAAQTDGVPCAPANWAPGCRTAHIDSSREHLCCSWKKKTRER
uniref:Uncharacterized protein n=1 Tax=Knipowitschia caucasica TaxID=637954 RepID=A0AAV2LHT6_KNICA